MIWRRLMSAIDRQGPLHGNVLDTSAMRSNLIEVYSQERSNAVECSVIVPIYNGARFLSDSIPAVLGQSDIICDILISDDCSEDGSLDAVLGWVKRYSGPHNVRVYRTSRPAVCEHMPLLVAASRSDRIIQAHQDDVSDPRRARVLTSALTGEVKLVTSVARLRTAAGVKEPSSDAIESLRKKASFKAFLRRSRGVMAGARYGMHRDIFRCFPALSWDYLSHGHDVLLHIRAHMIGRCEIVYEPLLTIGVHPDQGSFQLFDKQDQATRDFDFALRRLAILKAARADLDFAHAAGFVDAERRQTIDKRLNEARRYFVDALVTNRELAIQRGFRLSWTRRVGRLG
jgi:hypothetical protein